jgi:hypothetical protein
MGVEAIVAIVIGLAGTIGGYMGGKKSGSGTAMGIAVDVVELLQIQVATLTQKGEEKDALIADLKGRVEVLEGLVTQRAEVEAVKIEVQGVRGVVDRIADRVGAHGIS